MSRTYKQLSQGCVRSPRGKVRAVVGGARRGAIPPSSWDDRPHDKQCHQPLYVAWRLLDDGREPRWVVARISRRFGILRHEAVGIVELCRETVQGRERCVLPEIGET